ncbi:MAG TPA: PAS domain S-box protein, partial [Chroococcidiopsis sp.]
MEINDRDYQLSLRDRQLRAFFEGALDAMLIMDDEGRYLDVNPAACDLLGLPKDLLLGRRMGEFIEGGICLVVPPPDSESPQPPPDSESPQPPQREYRLLRADGSDRIVECAATPHFLPHRHLAVLRDITPRKSLERSLQQANRDLQQLNQELEQRVEQRTAELSHANHQLQREIAERQIVQDALRCSEAKLNDVLDSTIAAISCARVYRDRTWRYEYISQGTEAVFGFTPQELMADPMLWIMQVLPEDQETVFS